MAFLLALDQGTTSSRAIVFDELGRVAAAHSQEFEQRYPLPGWVEHDPEEIWNTQLSAATTALADAGLKASDIAALGITNQRETVVVWDRSTGEPIYPAIVWQDRRTATRCQELQAAGHQQLVQRKTGLLLDPYFSATKIAWILDSVPGSRERADRGELACGTIDSWLIHKLTAGTLHVTDASNASRTSLMDIHTGAWDQELLDLFAVPPTVLPAIRSSSEIYGEVSETSPLAGIPIGGVAGDQQAALFGQRCFDVGAAKNTYGTGCFMLLNTGSQAIASRHNLLTTIAWKLGDLTEYALEGSVFVGGAVVSWLRDELGLIESSDEIEPLAKQVDDSGGIVIVPAFAGLGAPHWQPHARGVIAGLTRGTSKAHVARAALESIAFQVADVINAMQNDAGMELDELSVDGGASVNDTLLQLQADVLQRPVVRAAEAESTALGAAYLAGLAAGIWPDRHAIPIPATRRQRFAPTIQADEASARRATWQKGVELAKAWAEA